MKQDISHQIILYFPNGFKLTIISSIFLKWDSHDDVGKVLMWAALLEVINQRTLFIKDTVLPFYSRESEVSNDDCCVLFMKINSPHSIVPIKNGKTFFIWKIMHAKEAGNVIRCAGGYRYLGISQKKKYKKFANWCSYRTRKTSELEIEARKMKRQEMLE